MSTTVDLSTRNCTTPGCPREATGTVAGLPFCGHCLHATAHRVLRAIAQRAEMRRQAHITAERESRRRTDEIGRRRRVNAAHKERIVDGRARALKTLERLHDQAVKRNDLVLAEGLAMATEVINSCISGRGRKTG